MAATAPVYRGHFVGTGSASDFIGNGVGLTGVVAGTTSGLTNNETRSLNLIGASNYVANLTTPSEQFTGSGALTINSSGSASGVVITNSFGGARLTVQGTNGDAVINSVGNFKTAAYGTPTEVNFGTAGIKTNGIAMVNSNEVDIINNGAAAVAVSNGATVIAAFTDVTTGNATTSAHGLAPKGTVGTTSFWRQDWTLATPSGAGDVTQAGQNNFSGSNSVLSGAIVQPVGTGKVIATGVNGGTNSFLNLSDSGGLQFASITNANLIFTNTTTSGQIIHYGYGLTSSNPANGNYSLYNPSKEFRTNFATGNWSIYTNGTALWSNPTTGNYVFVGNDGTVTASGGFTNKQYLGASFLGTDSAGHIIPVFNGGVLTNLGASSLTVTKTNFILNTVYTNTSGDVAAARGVASLTTAGVTGRAALDLMVDQAGGTTFAMASQARVDTTVAVTLAGTDYQEMGAWLSTNATYYWTNSSAGSGDAASLVAGTGQLITGIGGAGPQGATGATGATGPAGPAPAINTNSVQLSSGASTINFVDGENTTVTGAVSGATATIGISIPRNGVIYANTFIPAVKGLFSTNYTCATSDAILFCTGTNQVITLLDATNAATITGKSFTIISASTTGSVIVTNANGVQTILGALQLAVPGTNKVTVVSNGSAWW